MGMFIHKRLSCTFLIKFIFKCVTRSCNTCRIGGCDLHYFHKSPYIILEAVKRDPRFSSTTSTEHIPLHLSVGLSVSHSQHSSLSMVYFWQKWFLVPKGPKEECIDNDNGSDEREWRMSFYEYEKSLMNDLDGMKPTIRLLKVQYLFYLTWWASQVYIPCIGGYLLLQDLNCVSSLLMLFCTIRWKLRL